MCVCFCAQSFACLCKYKRGCEYTPKTNKASLIHIHTRTLEGDANPRNLKLKRILKPHLFVSYEKKRKDPKHTKNKYNTPLKSKRTSKVNLYKTLTAFLHYGSNKLTNGVTRSYASVLLTIIPTLNTHT